MKQRTEVSFQRRQWLRRNMLSTLLISFTLLAATQAAGAQPTAKPQTSTTDAAKVLDPNQFGGAIKRGYAEAKAHPEIAKKLFCYCGCDVTESHQTLLDCYTDPSKHAADCKECIDEMHVGTTMLAKGKTIADAQQAIHAKYGKEYPFDEPSAAYLRYLANAKLKLVKSGQAEPAR